MEIPGKPPISSPQVHNRIKDALPDVLSSNHSGSRVENDTVDLSANANKIREMVHTANNLPDVRAEKVAALKRRIEAGTYRIMNQEVASHLIGETMENNAILNHIEKTDD